MTTSKTESLTSRLSNLFAEAADSKLFVRFYEHGGFWHVARNHDRDPLVWHICRSDWTESHMIRIAVDGSIRDACSLMPLRLS